LIEEIEFKRRKKNVLSLLKEKELKIALIYYDEINIANGWYLSGWCPQFESGSILVTDEGYMAILGGPESEPFARIESNIQETKNIPVFMVPDEEYPYAEITNFKRIFNEIFGDIKKINRIGIVGLSKMPYGVYKLLKEEIKDISLVDITEDYEALRIIKSEYEINLIQKSFNIADEAFKDMFHSVKEGKSELELAAMAESKMRSLGANWFGFKSIVAAGKRSNGVVPTASKRKIRNGEMLLLGISPRYEGYASSIGYTAVVGNKPTSPQKDFLKILSEAFLVTREMLKPGMVGKENYSKIKRFFSKKGNYEKYIVCPFVHTIGLNEAEAPFFGPNSEDVLKPNMTVCIDVSLWNHPIFNGSRVETGFLITKDGYKPLSNYANKLIEDLENI